MTDPREAYFMDIFGWSSPDQLMQNPKAKCRREIVAAALNRAEEIRRFEIGLYWQRALYFWGFNVAIFAGFGLFFTAPDNTAHHIPQSLVAFLLALLGLFITVAWWCMSEGAKAWQESWEEHVYFLENDVTGKLLKTQFKGKSEFFSVTKINKSVIAVIGVFWLIIAALSAIKLLPDGQRLLDWLAANLDCVMLAIIGAFVIALLLLKICYWRSDLPSCQSCKCNNRTITSHHRRLPIIKSCEGG